MLPHYLHRMVVLPVKTGPMVVSVGGAIPYTVTKYGGKYSSLPGNVCIYICRNESDLHMHL